MQAATYDTPIFLDAKSVSQNSTTGDEVVTWTSITGKRPIMAEFRDVLPSRSEALKQGIVINTSQSRVRFPFIAGVDSSMRLRVNRGVGGEKPVPMGNGVNAPAASVYQIVGDAALIGGRKEAIEILVESYSS